MGAARSLGLGALFAVVLAALCLPALAVEDPKREKGFDPGKLYDFGEVDQVNLFNGNLMLAIPIGQRYAVGGGLSYGLTLTYNSNVWEHWERSYVTGSGQTEKAPFSYIDLTFNAGAGWTLSLGKLGPPGTIVKGSDQWVYVGEDGAQHGFFATLHEGEAAGGGVFYSRDGSYLRLRTASGTNPTSSLWAEVEFPDGTIRRFTRPSSSSSFALASIRDRFGNQVNVTATATQWVLSDGHRTQTVNFTTLPATGDVVVDEVRLAGVGGAVSVWDFSYTEPTIARSCTDEWPGSEPTVTVSLLASVTLPDDSKWDTSAPGSYAAACSEPGSSGDDHPGVLRKLKLPTLGSLEWTYQEYQYETNAGSSGGLTWTATSTGVQSKRVLNAAGSCETWDGVGCQWTYAWQRGAAGSGERKTTVTYSTGDQTVFHFDERGTQTQTGWSGWEYGLPFKRGTTDGAGRYLSQEVYDGTAATGVKKRSVYLRYERDKLPPFPPLIADFSASDWYDSNRRVASERTIYHDDGGRFGEVTHSLFDGVGHYRRSLTSGSFDSGNARTAHTDYNPGRGVYAIALATNSNAAGHTYTAWPAPTPWVLGTSTESWQSEGTATAKQQTCFDAATGFLLRTRALAGASPAANDLVTVYTADGAGNLASERHYGGDVQALGTGALCSLALPAEQYRVDHTTSAGVRATSRWVQASGAAMPFYSLQATIDAATGLPSSSWDVSGIRTDYEYDPMGRLTWAKPEAGHGAWSEYQYAKAAGTARANVLVLQRANGSKSGAILAQNQFIFDFMGRLATEQQVDAAGAWRSQTTTWNSMGWKRSATELGSGTATVYKSFDPFGRPQTITPSDGAAHDVTLSYNGVRQVSRTVRYNATSQLSTTTERYDRQGRLYQVEEPSAAGGANTTTTYGYDVGGRLSAVFMAGGGLSQGREFTYDNRGFLLRERHPEKGTWGNGYVRYLSYDALGNPGRKIDSVDSPAATTGAEVDLTFTYDRASRLTHQYAKGVLFKSFDYGTANLTGNRRLGRMWRASRYNYVWLGPSPYTVLIQETYTFGGPAGAVSARATQSYVNGAAGDAFTQGWAYDQLGNVTTLTYPRCTAAACTGTAAATSRTVSFAHTNGWLTSVPGYATSIGYHPNGMVHQIAHANGVTYTQAADPSGMRRPGSYSVTNSATGAAMWQSGAYAYDGAGNVTAIGGATNSYDAVSRLVSGSVFTGPLASGVYRTQSAEYDPFGNMKSLTTNGSWLNTPTSPTTNRFDGQPYDNSGAMTSWNGNAYDREDLGLVWRVASAGFAYAHIYTADDERIWTFHEGQNRSRWTLRDLDNKVLREFDNNAGTWTVQRDYVHRDSALLAAVLSTGIVNHLHPDHLGTPRLITRNNGPGPFQLAYHAYYPYGVEATAFNQDDERLKFTGHERDLGVSWSAADDLDYMHARYYNAQVGRFLSVDPVGGNSKRPQSWNRYAYVLGNPLKYTDPYGLAPHPDCPKPCDDIEVIGKDPYKAFDGAAFLRFILGRRPGVENRLEGVILNLRDSYQEQFEYHAVEGNYAAAYIDYFGLAYILPESEKELGLELAMAALPGGKLAKIAKKPARELISGGLKRSKSYREELANSTYEEILRLANGKGEGAQAARQMKKLIEQSARLMEKTSGAPR